MTQRMMAWLGTALKSSQPAEVRDADRKDRWSGRRGLPPHRLHRHLWRFLELARPWSLSPFEATAAISCHAKGTAAPSNDHDQTRRERKTELAGSRTVARSVLPDAGIVLLKLR